MAPLLIRMLMLAAPTAAATAPAFTGPPLSEVAVSEVVEHHRTEIDACLDDAIRARTEKKKKVAEGPVTIRFVIDPRGRVAKAGVVRGKPRNPEFEACILPRLKSWSFPKPEDGKNHPIEYPFDLKVQK